MQARVLYFLRRRVDDRKLVCFVFCVLTQGLEGLLQCLHALKNPLNSRGGGQQTSMGLGLGNKTSAQLARYPGDGRGYVRHRDTPESAQDSEEAERKVNDKFCVLCIQSFNPLSIRFSDVLDVCSCLHPLSFALGSFWCGGWGVLRCFLRLAP